MSGVQPGDSLLLENQLCSLSLGRCESSGHPMSPFLTAAAGVLGSAFDGAPHSPLMCSASPGSAVRLPLDHDSCQVPTKAEEEQCRDTHPGQNPGCPSSSCTDAAGIFNLSTAFTCTTAVSASQLSSALGCPNHAVKAVCGKRAKMEDAFSVQTNFFDLPLSPVDGVPNKLPARIAVQVGEQLEQMSPVGSVPLSPGSTCVPSLSTDQEHSYGCSSSSSTGSDSGVCDTLHFFGVYDGHGGTEAAQHCANRLHHHLSQALAVVGSAGMHAQNPLCIAEASGGQGVQCQAEWTLCHHGDAEADCSMDSGGLASAFCSAAACSAQGEGINTIAGDMPYPLSEQGEGDMPAPAAVAAAAAADAAAAAAADARTDAAEGLFNDSASSGSGGDGADGSARSDTPSITHLLEDALKEAFLRTDAEFAADGSAAMVGSTAVVALVGSKKMWIANCGDSRAVLCRSGKAIQLTDDHKPEREDEAERVEKAGGQVLFWNGHRVMGVLAMSRAIGDHGLRPYVIPEPEITVLHRASEDDFLLLASDGLWDVMSNQEAVNLAMRCLTRAWEKGASRKAAVRIAASVLTKAALDRGSKDNVTVVIVDLKAPKPTSSDGEACACSSDPCSGGGASTGAEAPAQEQPQEQQQGAEPAHTQQGEAQQQGQGAPHQVPSLCPQDTLVLPPEGLASLLAQQQDVLSVPSCFALAPPPDLPASASAAAAAAALSEGCN